VWLPQASTVTNFSVYALRTIERFQIRCYHTAKTSNFIHNFETWSCTSAASTRVFQLSSPEIKIATAEET
jgi:hypothetical protein